jgi:hypothetical protein
MRTRYTVLVAFMAGYIVNDLVPGNNHIGTSPAKAEVAGMASFDLSNDYDFKSAVRRVVRNNCTANGSSIDC